MRRDDARDEREYEALATAIAAGLRELRHPADGQPLVRDVKLRKDAFAGPYEALAPDLTLELADGAAVSILNSDTLVRRLDDPYGNHRPEGLRWRRRLAERHRQ